MPKSPAGMNDRTRRANMPASQELLTLQLLLILSRAVTQVASILL